MISKWWRK